MESYAEVMYVVRKRVEFGEFDVPIPKGHERITDKDSTTEYLFIHAPREIYTICFDSSMPFYDSRVLNGYEEGSSLEMKLSDRRIVFFCPFRRGIRKDGLWYFNIEFSGENGEVLTLPGQIVVNSDEVYRRTVNGKLPFIQILAEIKLKNEANNKAIV